MKRKSNHVSHPIWPQNRKQCATEIHFLYFTTKINQILYVHGLRRFQKARYWWKPDLCFKHSLSTDGVYTLLVNEAHCPLFRHPSISPFCISPTTLLLCLKSRIPGEAALGSAVETKLGYLRDKQRIGNLTYLSSPSPSSVYPPTPTSPSVYSLAFILQILPHDPCQSLFLCVAPCLPLYLSPCLSVIVSCSTSCGILSVLPLSSSLYHLL